MSLSGRREQKRESVAHSHHGFGKTKDVCAHSLAAWINSAIKLSLSLISCVKVGTGASSVTCASGVTGTSELISSSA